MCGILGVIQKKQTVDRGVFQLALDKLKLRGPESEGKWFSDDGLVALGHRRLAIIDLSPLGNQPMSSIDGRYFITFNGEIYNYKEIRDILLTKGWKFKSRSDTEIILYACIEWGSACLERLNGMFAFAIWDNLEHKLFAARDRLGEKPFKYYLDEESFIFASEVKAILSFPKVKKEIDWPAVDLALSLRYVPSPYTGFRGINKLPAGHFLFFQNGLLEIKQYWNPDSVKINKEKDEKEWQDELWSLFKDSVQKRMISDVSVGSFLSGGIDSSSVVAAISEVHNKPIDTFVISMDGVSEDQKYAKMVADFFHTNHHEIVIDNIDYRKTVLGLSRLYDEPFFDQSALPSVLISQEIKKKVTVVLSGDGSDELFGGYNSFRFAKFLNIYKKIFPSSVLPGSILKFFPQKLAYRIEMLDKEFFDSYAEYYSLWKQSLPQSKLYITKEDLYLENIIKDKNSVRKQFKDWFGEEKDIVRAAMLADIKGILADGYMTKIDIAAMGSAVEVRPPFLDHRLVELSSQIPTSLKIKNGVGKFIWKELMKDKLPAEVLKRSKMGFAIPLDRIIANQLRSLVEEIIFDKKSNLYQYFQFSTVQRLWSDHLNKKADYSNHLWSLLMFELWVREYIK